MKSYGRRIKKPLHGLALIADLSGANGTTLGDMLARRHVVCTFMLVGPHPAFAMPLDDQICKSRLSPGMGHQALVSSTTIAQSQPMQIIIYHDSVGSFWLHACVARVPYFAERRLHKVGR